MEEWDTLKSQIIHSFASRLISIFSFHPIDDDDGWHCCFRIIIFSVDSASAPLFSRISREYKLILTFHCVVFGCLLLLLLKWHNSTSKQKCRLFHSSKHFSLAEKKPKSSKSSKFSHFLAIVFHYFCLIFILRTHKESYCKAHMSFRAQKKRITLFLFFFPIFSPHSLHGTTKERASRRKASEVRVSLDLFHI